MKFHTLCLSVLLLFLPSLVMAQVYSVVGGDNIGTDNSTVNGNDAISAHGDWIDQNANLGLNAIPFTSDGTATLYDFRIIAAVISSRSFDSNGNIDWAGHNWTFGIFRRDDFIAQRAPIIAHAFGATPYNWSGFRRVNDLRNVPDTAPFGNFSATGDSAGELYELRFNLENVYDDTKGAIFAAPLPAGEYFLAVQSDTSHESYGEAGLAITRSAEHPNYWHDNGLIAPQPIVPNMTPDESVGVAFSVRVKTPGVEGDFNGDGVLDILDLHLLQLGMREGSVTLDITGDWKADIHDQDRWVHSLFKTSYGDANLDGKFDSADLVTVFAAGKYETQSPAMWEEGDWNGDGVFDTADLVLAFADGGYE